MLIHHLNPIIRGWSAYYSPAVAKAAFGRLDFHTYLKLQRWAKRRHPRASGRWISAKYWRLDRGTWTFGTPDGTRLHRHDQTPIRRHVKVRGEKSPFDGDWRYWATRLGHYPDLYGWEAVLLKQQRGRCARCGLYFRDKGDWELDHLVPTSEGGPRALSNLQLLHPWCHDQKTVGDRSQAEVRMTTRRVSEEPDEGKLARPVLQPSAGGDPCA